ncbi:hypothetical protein D7Y13_13715 [Corallococcus praedator]|uniref:Lipase helper protein n=1 Tax=Corallococcus praedator TaxID=2316724 RepID=A0ABX9QLA2_9BACT|nr:MULTISPECIES: hypothetical protein [Corallococcus]RKH35554.1 hypothetical protein D7X75_03965 [Corallococcus sp. CA031C]RKI09844.1 hypothetical protein D7Y13_13715 [Corallococcus praedator]
MKRSRTWVVLGFALLVGLGGVWLWMEPQSSDTASPVATAQPQTPAALAVAPAVAAASVKAPPSLQVPEAPLPPGTERPPLMPKELIAQVLEDNKPLGLFMHYHKHVLLDEQGRDAYRKLLSGPDMMKTLADGLKDPGRGEVEPREQYERLMEVDYFKAALAWKDNPQREQLLAHAEDIILQQNIFGGQDTERRYMLAGGKMEMYRLLAEQDMQRALALGERARGTNMEQLTAWMATEEQRRRTQEEQIRLEMQAQARNSAAP